MYKVFLVEDEIVVRESIRDSINWQETNFIFCGDAPDGEIALPLINKLKPDIVITDIRMPFMDGLELSRILKKMMPRVKIIVLSGHQEFEYAKKAISIGVQEYILKPIGAKELIAVLDNVAEKLDMEKTHLQSEGKLNEYMKDNEMLRRERYLNNLIMGAVSTREIFEQADQYAINLMADYYLVVKVDVQAANEDASEKVEELNQAIDLYASENQDAVIKFNRSKEEIILIVKGNTPERVSVVKNGISNLVERATIGDTSLDVNLSSGNTYERIRDVAKSYMDALISSSTNVMSNAGILKAVNELFQSTDQKIEIEEFNDQIILNAMKQGNRTILFNELNTYFSKFEDGCLNMITCLYLVIRMNTMLTKILEDVGIKTEILRQNQKELPFKIADLGSAKALMEYLTETIESVLSLIDHNRTNTHQQIIETAKNYINENYENEDLTLNSVARYVNVSPNHFSSIFSRETDSTFIKYLTEVRICRAKELLHTTNQRKNEIALAVGYKDPQYFSYLFKKNVGTSPTQYRNQFRETKLDG